MIQELAFLLVVLPGALEESADGLVPRTPIAKVAVRAAPLPGPAPAQIDGATRVGPEPRTGTPTPGLTSPRPAPAFERRLVVKLEDGVRARAREDGSLVSLAGRDLAPVEALAAALGARFEPLIRLPEPVLADLEARAAERSARAQPDLAGILAVRLPAADVAALEAAGDAFQALAEVELAYVETNGAPPPSDLPPATPGLVPFQTYRATNPGLGVDVAWSVGLRGAGIRIADCEYAWNAAHEDLADVALHLEPGQTVHPLSIVSGFDEHGTAAVGVLASAVNAYGTSGIAPDAEIRTFPERSVQEGFRRATAIAHAAAASRIGDVVLLEMQAIGAGGNYGPAELEPAVWLITRAATDAGVVVVGAAGNGNQDLDSPLYASYAALGDSGAILVGAGSASASHVKLPFSTFGSRVDVQGWGESVFTTGYGDFAAYGGDKNQRYTHAFGGTSSASPFVAGACALLQELAQRNCGSPLSSRDLRALLVATGVPQQGGGGHVGPFVSLPAAIAALPAALHPSFCAGDGAVAPCPCGNDGASCRGCANSVVSDGARLVASGVASVASDSFVLRCEGMPPTATSLYFQGSVAWPAGGVALADGLRCVAGTIQRIGLEPSVGGRSAYGGPLGDVPVSVKGQIPAAGGTFHYQTWYRDPAAFCTIDTFNLSNGIRVVWAP